MAYVDPELQELWTLAIRGPSARNTNRSSTAELDILNTEAGRTAFKQQKRDELCVAVNAKVCTYVNPYANASFAWTNTKFEPHTDHTRTLPLADVFPQNAHFQNGQELYTIQTELDNKKAIVSRKVLRSGYHVSGDDDHGRLCAFCHLGGGTVVDKALLFTVLYWADSHISDYGLSFPPGRGVSMGSNASRRSSVASNTTVATVAGSPETAQTSRAETARQETKKANKRRADEMADSAKQIANTAIQVARAAAFMNASESSRDVQRLKHVIVGAEAASINTPRDLLIACKIRHRSIDTILNNIVGISEDEPSDVIEDIRTVVQCCRDLVKEGGISRLQSVFQIPYGHASSINLKLNELEVEGEESIQGRRAVITSASVGRNVSISSSSSSSMSYSTTSSSFNSNRDVNAAIQDAIQEEKTEDSDDLS
jgi:hypothetical protein